MLIFCDFDDVPEAWSIGCLSVFLSNKNIWPFQFIGFHFRCETETVHVDLSGPVALVSAWPEPKHHRRTYIWGVPSCATISVEYLMPRYLCVYMICICIIYYIYIICIVFIFLYIIYILLYIYILFIYINILVYIYLFIIYIYIYIINMWMHISALYGARTHFVHNTVTNQYVPLGLCTF